MYEQEPDQVHQLPTMYKGYKAGNHCPYHQLTWSFGNLNIDVPTPVQWAVQFGFNNIHTSSSA
jgi:hypothetical protein